MNWADDDGPGTMLSMRVELIRSRDVIFIEDQPAPANSLAKLLDHDTPLQVPAFTAIEEVNDSTGGQEQEQYTIRIAPPAYHPTSAPAPAPSTEPQRQYLIPLPIIEEQDSISNDESLPPTPDTESDLDDAYVGAANRVKIFEKLQAPFF
jgi:hypothetical protein